jgi:hypothetical protein
MAHPFGWNNMDTAARFCRRGAPDKGTKIEPKLYDVPAMEFIKYAARVGRAIECRVPNLATPAYIVDKVPPVSTDMRQPIVPFAVSPPAWPHFRLILPQGQLAGLQSQRLLGISPVAAA